jgi:signal transduction histidine kinase
MRAIPSRIRRLDPLVLDVYLTAFVLTLGAVDLAGTVTHTVEGVKIQATDGLAVLLLLVGCLPLLQRRQAPLAVLAITSSGFFLLHALGYARPPIPYGPLIALFSVAARYRPAVCVTVTAGVMAGAVGAALAHNDPLTEDRFLTDLVTITGVGLFGYAVQLSRSRATLLEERAAQLEREHETRMELAVEREMARIAGELHDIVAHHVTVMVAQAGAGRRVFDDSPEQGRQALASIEQLGRSALGELRRLLGVMRGRADGERDPQPTLAQLPVLIEQIRRVGLPVTFTVKGAPRPLPLGVELNAFRIVQEALTNAVKHASGASADVTVTFLRGVLLVDVRNTGASLQQEPVAGHGLIGMQRRVALLAGELVVGPMPEGGFQVRARLPVDGADQ